MKSDQRIEDLEEEMQLPCRENTHLTGIRGVLTGKQEISPAETRFLQLNA